MHKRKKLGRSQPMSNSFLEKRFASVGASDHVCFCGAPIYPSSIWQPIIKVTQNANTTGSCTYEFHADCLEKFLERGEGSTDDLYPRNPKHKVSFARIEKPRRGRTCIVTNEKITESIAVILGERTKTVAVKLDALKEVLKGPAAPPKCSKEAIFFEWCLNPNDHTEQEVRQHIESAGGEYEKVKRTATRKFETAIELLEVLYKLMLERPFEFLNQFCIQRQHYFLALSGRGVSEVNSEITFSEMVPLLYQGEKSQRGMILSLIELFKEDFSYNQRDTTNKCIQTLLELGALNKFNPKMASKVCYSLRMLGDYVLKNELRGNANKAYSETLFNSHEEIKMMIRFLMDIDKREEFEYSDIVEGLVSKSGFVRQLCAQRQSQL